MPYALRHSVTGELLSCSQTNGYELKYYGILLWEDAPDAEERLAALLRAERYRPQEEKGGRRERHAAEWEQVQELARWQPVLLSEREAKLANAKLRNDAGLRVFLREGALQAEPVPEDAE
jgi:hypothetical protein